MKPNTRSKAKAFLLPVAAFALCGMVYAATHFLVSWSFSYDEDASSEFSRTQNYFSVAQARRMDPNTWAMGYKFTVEYGDGIVAEFELSGRGRSCVLGICKWVGTLPFNNPVIVTGKRSGRWPSWDGTIVSGGLSPFVSPRPISNYPAPMPFGGGWSVWVGPLSIVSAPALPPGCLVPCPNRP